MSYLCSMNDMDMIPEGEINTQNFGKLTVLREDPNGATRWFCRNSTGEEKSYDWFDLFPYAALTGGSPPKHGSGEGATHSTIIRKVYEPQRGQDSGYYIRMMPSSKRK
jgi:hypothetical protein